MKEQHEAELRIAVVEGLISRQKAEALREEALRMEQSPLQLLVARGVLLEESLVPLQKAALDEALRQAAEARGSPTLEHTSAKEEGSQQQSPPFPASAWERYQGVRFLGQGGMGQVFLAYDTRLRRNVALKFVRNDDASLAGRFLSEARAQARVEHERVCQVHEVGEVQGRPYIAMQFVDGQPLSQLASGLTVEQKALVLRDAAEGIHAAHRAGIIHRDLKPSNILVERTEDGRLKPFVMDFGLARDWKERSTTATGAALGTPHYMAPEQARGEVDHLDRRADVYSLGATLYHLLTGQPPIPGANGLEVLNNISTLEPRPPRALNPDLPVDLEAIVLKCLEKDRSARYDSARALAEDLDRFLSGEPVQARPTGLVYRLRKKARKHRLAVSTAAIALLALVLTLGWAVLTRQEAARREQLARSFTEQVERMEAMARYSGLSRLHDIRADRQALKAHMRQLEEEIQRGGALAVGPGHYALGRGYMALDDEERAREHLEAAWQSGFREPRAAYALALVLGHLYQEQLQEAERLRSPEQREARKQDLQRQYRDPALALLRQSEGASVPSTEYVAALIAFYEERFDEALGRLDAIWEQLPWFYEAPMLRGDIFRARAAQRWNQGDREGALADFEAGRKAYALAATTAESVPAIHLALARLERTAMVMELYGKGDVLPPFTRGMEAVRRALTADPDSSEPQVQQARFYNRLAEYRMSQGGDVEEALEKAIAAGQRALALEPGQPARMELGQSFWRWARSRQGRGLDPVEQLRQAVETLEGIAPEERDYEFHATLGLVFKIWADFEDQRGADSLPHRGRAIESYREAIRLDARVPDAWINLGIAYLTRALNARVTDPLGDLEQARTALETSQKLNPQNYVPYFLGGTLHSQLASRRRDSGGDARPDLAAALELYQRGIAINPRIPQLHNGMGSVLIEQAREEWDRGGDPFPVLARAQAAYERAIAEAPKHGYAYNNLGEVHAERAAFHRLAGEDPGPDVQAAAVSYRKAIELLPGLVDPWANLLKVHATRAAFELEHGRDPRRSLDRAEEALKGALERNPKDAQTRLYQGEIRGLRARWLAGQRQARPSDFEEAARSFEEALELEPRRPDYRVAFGHFCREWGLWLRGSGLDPSPALQRGLALAEEAIASRPTWADALLLRASLNQHPIQEDVDRALALNPHLARWWRRHLPSRATTTP